MKLSLVMAFAAFISLYAIVVGIIAANKEEYPVAFFFAAIAATAAFVVHLVHSESK